MKGQVNSDITVYKKDVMKDKISIFLELGLLLYAVYCTIKYYLDNNNVPWMMVAIDVILLVSLTITILIFNKS